MLIGQDPERIEFLYQMMYRQAFWRGGDGYSIALDPAKGTWRLTGTLATARYLPALLLLQDEHARHVQDADGVAIRRRARDRLDADHVAGAGLVLDEELLAEGLREVPRSSSDAPERVRLLAVFYSFKALSGALLK
jgi:hypothetical protein